MSHEVHVTRGTGFGEAGADPITAEQWQQAVAAHPEIVAREGSAFGRLGDRPVVFNGGVIAATSPDGAAMQTLHALAKELSARVFGEDGVEYGRDALGAVRSTLATAFPDLDAAVLDEEVARSLSVVAGGEPGVAAEVAKKAVAQCSGLTGAAADVALAYLACRAVEGGGDPPATATCVAAHLHAHAAERLAGFRREPTEAWVAEVEALARTVAKRPGAYVVRKCSECGAANRVALFPPDGRRAKCGRCKTLLPSPD